MKLLSRFGGIGGALLIAGTVLLSCSKDQEFVPAVALGTEYYPVVINTQRTFAVADTTWSLNFPTVVNYQLREAIVDTFRDASGNKAYRVVRFKRQLATDAWKSDSVYVLTTTKQILTLLRDNRRTVELIFPVRNERGWNQNIYNGSAPDTITDLNRRYHRVGQPLTVGGKVYDETLITLDEGSAAAENLYYLTQNQQVFAKGTGPVLRRRRIYNYCADDPNCTPKEDYSYIGKGSSHTQTLLEYGPL